MTVFKAWAPSFALALLALPMSVFAQDQDVIRVTVGAEVERHSNLLRLDQGVSPTTVTGDSSTTSRGDTLIRGTLGLGFDREYSLQRFRASALVSPTKYSNFSRFDHIAFSGDVNWDWEISGPLSGQVGFRASRTLLGFYAALGPVGDRNLVTRTEPYFVGRLRITPSWRLRMGLDQSQVSNSLANFKDGDFTANGTEAGIEFAPGTGTEFSVNLRNVRGKYPNLQTLSLLGVPFAGNGLDNSYKQNDLIARLRYRPSEDSLIGGFFGVTKRSYDIDGSRNYSGPTAGLELNWRPSGAFYMNANLNKRLDLPSVFTTNHVDVTELLLRPNVVLTGKTSLTGRLEYSDRRFSGDPTTGFERKDTVFVYGVGAAYDFSRVLRFTADLIQEERSSNIAGGNFKNTIMWFGATGRF